MCPTKNRARSLTKFVMALAAALALGHSTAIGAPGDLLQTFANPTPAADDHFGYCLGAVGSNVLVGAYRDDTGQTDAGAAYLLNGSTGALIRTFQKPAPADSDRFGISVAAVGSNVLVGAYWDDTGATNAGAAYLLNGSTGALLRTFQKPTPAEYDYFGYSVAAVGSNVLVGAYCDDTGATNAGAAYLFDGSTGALLKTFQKATPVADDNFGYSVAAVGANVLVGASYDDTGATDAGAAYLFDGSTGALLRTIQNPTPDSGDRFGASVAAAGSNVLVGAYRDDAGGTNAGAAYLFDGATGTLLETFGKPTPADNDYFGCSVAAVGNNVLVGAYGDDTGTADAGAAYLFEGIIPGDANTEGLVDGQDFTILKAYYGQGTPESPVPWAHGNFNGDYLVDGQDFTILKAYYGQSGSQAVPEPGALALLIVGALALLLRRRRR